MLLPQHRLLSLALSISCRGMKPMYGLLSPIFAPKVNTAGRERLHTAGDAAVTAGEAHQLAVQFYTRLALYLCWLCTDASGPPFGTATPTQSICTSQVLKNFFELWFWDSKPNLVRRLMRLLLTRQLLQSMHPCGRTYGEVSHPSALQGALHALLQPCYTAPGQFCTTTARTCRKAAEAC